MLKQELKTLKKSVKRTKGLSEEEKGANTAKVAALEAELSAAAAAPTPVRAEVVSPPRANRPHHSHLLCLCPSIHPARVCVWARARACVCMDFLKTDRHRFFARVCVHMACVAYALLGVIEERDCRVEQVCKEDAYETKHDPTSIPENIKGILMEIDGGCAAFNPLPLRNGGVAAYSPPGFISVGKQLYRYSFIFADVRNFST